MTVLWPMAGTYRRLGYVIPDEFSDEEPVNLTYWHFDGAVLEQGPAGAPTVLRSGQADSDSEAV